ncbi:MAG: Crp/Fnr family transcriptional regulator [Trebonia sp.]
MTGCPTLVIDADPFPADELRTALRRSVLDSVPAALRDEVLVGAVRSESPKGRTFDGPPLFLLVTGLIRAALDGSDGRRFAVAYLRQGDLVGSARLTGRRYPLMFEAVTECRMLRLDAGAFDDLRRRRPEIGVAVADQLNRHIDDILHETALAAFGHVRERILRHLLALAIIHPHAPATCEITHDDLAHAVGSARETVTRAIGVLKGEGLLGGDHGVLVVPDPERLRRELIRWPAPARPSERGRPSPQ